MAVEIHESGMSFGEYDDNQVFQIEKSRQYTEKLMQSGIKSCEFVLRREEKLYFVEAKTTCPRQIEADSPEEKKWKYQEYINDIVLKMRHSLILYANILLDRYADEGVPEKLMEKDLSDVEIRLVLVVKNAEKAWLEPFVEVFNKALHDELKIWKIPCVMVINELTARKKGLVGYTMV
ncbi:MAG: hypothetical protein LIP11_15460 [Clostridiales bacterium]|nr:hypothetical protein [Clostridiales bacterium]